MGRTRVKSMKSVNIAELKNRLSGYLNDVKAGEEILVRDRNQPVARIVPLARSMDEDEELLALASQGKLRLGHGVLDESFWAMPPPRCAAPSNRNAMKTKGKRKPAPSTTAFWDTSALVPLCCFQPQSAKARQVVRTYSRQVVWWGTVIDAVSSLNRLTRDGTL